MASFSKRSDGGIQLSNDRLSVMIYPKYGGKIASFRSGDKEWLWQNPNLSAFPEVTAGASYDDHFYGGIDELFPNDFPTEVNGVKLPDHGELWSRVWDHEIRMEDGNPVVDMSVTLQSVPVKAERKIFMNETEVVIENRLTNGSDQSIPYLWVIHPALRIGPHIRFHLPPGEVIVEDEIGGRVPKGTSGFRWPGTDIGVDLSSVPEEGNALESYCILNLPEGRFFVEDTTRKEALSVQFPKRQFPHLWLFMPLGGWRNHYVAVIEPASGYPTDLKDAVGKGTHSVLEARSTISASLRFSIVNSQDIEFIKLRK